MLYIILYYIILYYIILYYIISYYIILYYISRFTSLESGARVLHMHSGSPESQGQNDTVNGCKGIDTCMCTVLLSYTTESTYKRIHLVKRLG